MPESQPRNLDRRTLARYVERGELTDKDVEKHLKNLPDLADEAVTIESHLDSHGPTPAN